MSWSSARAPAILWGTNKQDAKKALPIGQRLLRRQNCFRQDRTVIKMTDKRDVYSLEFTGELNSAPFVNSPVSYERTGFFDLFQVPVISERRQKTLAVLHRKQDPNHSGNSNEGYGVPFQLSDSQERYREQKQLSPIQQIR